MTGQILPYEHWCPDRKCGEVIEDKGFIRRVRRWFIQKEDGSKNGLFNSPTEAQEFADKYGITIHD